MRRSASLLILGLILAMAVPAFAQTEIRMVTYGESYDAYRAIEKAFNESNPGYRLVIENYPFGEYIAKLTVMIASGAPPDVFQTWAQYKSAWAENGFLMDLSDRWAQSEVAQNAELYPFVMDAAIHNGRIYGVPHDFSPQLWILNTDEFDRAGIPVPDDTWTVDDVAEYATKMTNEDRGVFGVQLSGHWSTSNWQWSVLYNGQGWLNEDRTEVLVEDPANIEMLEYWYDLVYSRRAANPPGVVPPAGDQWQGGFAMWQGWTGWVFDVAKSSPYNFTVATLPKGPANNYSFAQGHMWSIPSNAPDPDKSWMLLEWLLSPEGQEAIVVYDNRQPLSNDQDLWGLYFSSLPSGKQAEIQDFVLGTLYGKNLIHTMTYWPTWDQVNTIMNTHLNTIFYNHQPPANAMNQAAAQIRAVLANN